MHAAASRYKSILVGLALLLGLTSVAQVPQKDYLKQWNESTAGDAWAKSASDVCEKNYVRPGDEAHATDWFSKAFKNFKPPDLPEPKNLPNAPNLTGLPEVLRLVMWVVLIAGGLIALYYILENGKLGQLLAKRKAAQGTSLMTEDESKRTEQDWLLFAKRAEQEHRYREAARAYFLATMVALDSARMLRLRPWETNWEHIHRFEQSPLAASVSLRDAGRLFDDIWYGNHEATLEHSTAFRHLFENVRQKLAEVKSA